MSRFLILFFLVQVVFTFSLKAQDEEDEQKSPTQYEKPEPDYRLSKEARIGDKFFDNLEYYSAAEYYLKSYKEDKQDHYSLFQLAESYRLYFDFIPAEKTYQKVVSGFEDKYPIARFWLAQMQKTNGKYEPARENYQKFIENYPTEMPSQQALVDYAKIELDGCILALNEYKKPVRDYDFKNLGRPVNTPDSDYAAMLFKHDSSIVVTSSREGAKGDDVDSRFGQIYSDNFRFEKGSSRWTEMSEEDNFDVTNTDKNDGAGVFNSDRTKFYYTSCFENEGECAIYVSEMDNGKWRKAERLNEKVNYPGVDNFQPSLSPGGDTLYFVSKRPGGYGMNDIYFSVKAGEEGEDWGEPENIGPEINTPFVDMSPAYYPEKNTIFFASNGHEGFGGLDVYMASGENFSKIKNIGLPFNSNRDDFYFSLGEKKGYLSSNRQGGLGNDDVYSFNIESRESLITIIEKDSLEDYKSFSALGKIVYDNDGEPAIDVKVNLVDDEGNTIKSLRTNEEGLIRFENLPSDKDYKIVIADDDPSLVDGSKYVVDNMEVKGSKMASKRTLFENIYFDFDKSKLRREARKVLREIVDYAQEHPEIQIEMRANTDAIGSDDYNARLSKSRGDAAYDYLVKKGIDKSSLVIDPRGEKDPIASNENPVGRQLNRRIEFYIVGGPGYSSEAMTYVVEPSASLQSVAQKFGMTVEELKALNDLESDELRAYQPLRVRRSGDGNVIAPVTMAMAGKGASSESIVSTSKEMEDNTSGEYDGMSQERTLSESEDYYIVKPLDTYYSIAKKFDMSVEQIKSLNNIPNNRLQIDSRIIVTRPAGTGLNEGDSNSGGDTQEEQFDGQSTIDN